VIEPFSFTSSDGYTFTTDGLGMVNVRYKAWNKSPVKSVYVSGRALLEYTAECVRKEKMQALAEATVEEILMGEK
jgi:hypothetical protein